MKLYTVAAALDRLSPDYRFSTSVYANTRLMRRASFTAI
jgi:D-alanyl-D-alanine carboxypeptidase